MSALPGAERVLIAALKSAGLAGGRVATRIGSTFPNIRVTLLGGPTRPTTNTGQPEFQIECWGAGPDPAHETQASELASDVEAAVEDGALVGTYTAGTIRGAYMTGGIIHSPDSATYRERYILTIGLLIQ